VDKKSIRRDSLGKLKSVKKRFFYDKSVANTIRRVIDETGVKSALLYLPLDFEVDLRDIIRDYRKKIKIFVPLLEKESFKMVEYRLPLERNGYGILEPKSSKFARKKVDLIIAPVISMDGSMRRVGFGKGMYDRFYEKLKNRPTVIFVQRVDTTVKSVVCQKHDIKSSCYVNSKEIMLESGRDVRDFTYYGGSRRRIDCRSFVGKRCRKIKPKSTPRSTRS
jgi:5-formyltetrahydrofolate cyclo-ligase